MTAAPEHLWGWVSWANQVLSWPSYLSRAAPELWAKAVTVSCDRWVL
jgi:hypothetical protein